MTVIDCGAHVGLFALWLQANYQPSRLLCVEPMLPQLAALRANVKDGASDVTVIGSGLGNEPQEVAEFFYFPRTPGNSTRRLAEKMINESNMLVGSLSDAKSFTAPITTLSSLIKQHKLLNIDLLKIDVEGDEEAVLEGLNPFHWPRVRQVVAEVFNFEGRAVRMKALLQRKGFNVRQLLKEWVGEGGICACPFCITCTKR